MVLMKSLVILSLSLALTSCTWNCKPEPPIVVTQYVKQDIPIKERPKPMTMLDVGVHAVSYKNLNEFLAQNKFKYGNNVFIAMDVRDYENLSLNTAELKRYIEQQQALINYYEEHINKPLPTEESE